MKKRRSNIIRKTGKEVTKMRRGRLQTSVIVVSIAALLMLMMPGMAMAKGVQVVELQSYKAVQFTGVIQSTPPNDMPPNDTPPNDTPPNDTPPETPPEVPPNTPPDTPPEYPPDTPPETPPEESCEKPPSTTQGEASFSGSRKVLPYTGGNSLLYQLLGLVLVLLGFGGLIGSMSVSKKKQA